MTRFWPAGLAVQVLTDDLITPTQFVFEARTHQVELVLRRWRVDQHWWRDWVCREYFLVRTRTGLLVVLYRDVLRGRWLLQRVYD